MLKFYKPDTYRAGDSVGYLVRRASNLMTGRVEGAFAHHEITFAQWIVLMNLRDGLASTAAEIARSMCHDTGALTRVLDNLEQRGFIERTRSREDRRTVELKLTDDGRRTVNALVPMVVGLLNTALADFTENEARDLTRLLAKLVDGIQAAAHADAEHLEPLS